MDWFLYDMDFRLERVNEWCSLDHTYLNKTAIFTYPKDDAIVCMRSIERKYVIDNQPFFCFFISVCNF